MGQYLLDAERSLPGRLRAVTRGRRSSAPARPGSPRPSRRARTGASVVVIDSSRRPAARSGAGGGGRRRRSRRCALGRGGAVGQGGLGGGGRAGRRSPTARAGDACGARARRGRHRRLHDRPVAFPRLDAAGRDDGRVERRRSPRARASLPGARRCCAGAGPFLLPVAASLRPARRRTSWRWPRRRAEATACQPTAAAATPGACATYGRYRARLAGVELLWGHVIVRARATTASSRTLARATRLAPRGGATLAVDAVCTAYALLPSSSSRCTLGCA